MAAADAAGVRSRVMAVFADLGAADEWPGTAELAAKHAAHYRLRFEIVRREVTDPQTGQRRPHGLIEHIASRPQQKWPDAARRYCTSDLKRAPLPAPTIAGELTHLRKAGVMARYPLIAGPLPPGLVTLSQWAARVGRSPGTIRSRWARRPGFPAPVGRKPGRGRHGGGLGELVYRAADLDACLPRPAGLDDAGISPGQRVTLGWFADHAANVARKTVTQYRDTPGFPSPGADGRYRYDDLAAWWHSRPGRGARRTIPGASA